MIVSAESVFEIEFILLIIVQVGEASTLKGDPRTVMQKLFVDLNIHQLRFQGVALALPFQSNGFRLIFVPCQYAPLRHVGFPFGLIG